jgi:hypothetical protein
MNTHTHSSEYMLLFRDTNWDRGLSLEEIQQVIDQITAWLESLDEQGKVKAGQPLLDGGKTVSGKGGRTVFDGPFAESKEAIGGYLLLRVDNLEEAVQIAKRHPALEYGMTIEIREVAGDCPVSQRVREQLAQAIV